MPTASPQIVLQHQHGSNDWIVTLVDSGDKLKLTTSELTSFRRFRMQAVIQANRLYPQMKDEEWMPILAEAMCVAQIIDEDLMKCVIHRR